MRQILIDGLAELGIELTEKQRHQLDVYQNEIMLWNGKYGLLASSVAQKELDVKHFLDSLSAYSVLKNMRFNTACDVGSGGGFPGLVLAILFPDKKFTLIDTGGIELKNRPFQEEIRAQAEIAIKEADVIIFLTDAKLGLTGDDKFDGTINYNHNQKSQTLFARWKVNSITFKSGDGVLGDIRVDYHKGVDNEISYSDDIDNKFNRKYL